VARRRTAPGDEQLQTVEAGLKHLTRRPFGPRAVVRGCGGARQPPAGGQASAPARGAPRGLRGWRAGRPVCGGHARTIRAHEPRELRSAQALNRGPSGAGLGADTQHAPWPAAGEVGAKRDGQVRCNGRQGSGTAIAASLYLSAGRMHPEMRLCEQVGATAQHGDGLDQARAHSDHRAEGQGGKPLHTHALLHFVADARCLTSVRRIRLRKSRCRSEARLLCD
jgi:hypothetical protein